MLPVVKVTSWRHHGHRTVNGHRAHEPTEEVVVIREIANVSALRPLKDSTNWQAIPVGTPLVAGYVPPSRFAWPPAAWARFAGSTEVRITPSAAVSGRGIQVLDVEQGDATPGQLPGWVNASRAAGQEPTAYLNYTSWTAAIRACTSAGVAVPQFWVGLWDNAQDFPSINVDGVTYTAVAHQYADPATSGGDYDVSVVAPYWPGVDPLEDDVPTYQVHIPDASTDSHIEMGVKGCAELYLHTGYYVELTAIAISFFGPTPSDPSAPGADVGGAWNNLVVVNNRPGPIGIPPGAVQVSVRYSCNGPWTLSANG